MEQENQEEVVLTYETLYEILRREKTRQGLQKIETTFTSDVLSYLGDKQQSHDESITKSDVFSASERDKLAIQIRNAKRLVRDLYELRERKIINMAINHSRTSAHIVDTEHLLPHEAQLFDSLNSVLSHNRLAVLQKILDLREPDIMDIALTPRHSEVKILPPKIETADAIVLPPKETIVTKPKQQQYHAPQVSVNSKTLRNIKFLSDVEQFVGEELELYGPYSRNDQASIPNDIADVLIKQGKAASI